MRWMGTTRSAARRAAADACPDRRDYCKLHIVHHYIARLLGPDFQVIPLGMVGADEAGDRLLAEMAEVGLDLRFVGRAEGRHTLARAVPDLSRWQRRQRD